MNDSDETYRAPGDHGLAVCLTAGGFLIFLVWQCTLLCNNLSVLRERAKQREPLVVESQKVQAGLQALANDLVEMAKTDPAAKAVVDRYQIQVIPPPAAGK